MTIAPERPADQTRGELLFWFAAMLSAGQLVWLVVMGFLAGGQFTPRDSPKSGALFEWPVVAVPSWLTIALAVAACVGAFLALRGRTGPDHFGSAVADIGITIIVLILLPGGLANVYSEAGGVVVAGFADDRVLGWHWIAAVFGILTLVALAVRLALALRAERREAAA